MKFEQVEKKVERPPAAHNVARLLDPESESQTIVNIAKFAVSIPAFNYLGAQTVIRDRVALGLGLETAVRTVRKAGAPAGREQNEALVRGFFSYDDMRKYSDARLVESYQGQFKISRDISVPTSPTFTILEKGKQIPVVLCGWKTFNLRRDQIRAWLSMLESGLFSFADYRTSPWEVLLFPEQDTAEGLVRCPRVIRPGEYNLLNASELRDLAAMYARAQKEAMPLAREIWEKREVARKERTSNERDSVYDVGNGPDVNQPDLFADRPES